MTMKFHLQLRSVLTNCCYFLLCKQSSERKWKVFNFQIEIFSAVVVVSSHFTFHFYFLSRFTPTQSHTLSMCRKFQFLCCSFSYHHLQLFIFIHLHVRVELMSSRGKKLTMKSPQDNLHLFMMIFFSVSSSTSFFALAIHRPSGQKQKKSHLGRWKLLNWYENKTLLVDSSLTPQAVQKLCVMILNGIFHETRDLLKVIMMRVKCDRTHKIFSIFIFHIFVSCFGVFVELYQWL